jgi:D-psicose/D-tagatose/L-ribulose 3-epimerase
MKRPVGIYYAYWQHEWESDFLPYIERVKKLGFEQLELNAMLLREMTSAQRRVISEKAKQEGILLSYGIGLDKPHDLASINDCIRLSGVEFMKQIIAAIEEMGGGLISGTVHGYWPAVPPKNIDCKEPMLQQSLKSMRILAPFAEEHGVSLNVEVINRFEQFLINTCDEALAYVNEINSPACNILLDTFHMNIEEDSIGDAIRRAGKRLASLHLGEPNRKPPGMGSGRMPWAEIKQALDDIDYVGPLVMEPFIMKGGQIGHDIAVWRDLVENPDLDALAAQSAVFVKETLR